MKLPILSYTVTYTFDPYDGYLEFCSECGEEPTLEGWKNYVIQDVESLLNYHNPHADNLATEGEVEV